MSNVVEFILKLKDMMSGGMQKAAATAQATMNSAERATKRVANMNRVAGVGVATAARTSSLRATRSIATLERALRMVERRRDISIDTREVRRANQIINSLQGRIDRLRGRRSGGMLASLGGMRGLVAGVGLMAGVGSVVNAGMQGQAQKASFEVMAGQQAGGQLYNDLTKFAQDSIFGNELYRNAQTMKAFGVETKEVMTNLRMLGDVSMGNKERLGSLTLAFSQIQSAGRLMGQDLLQLVNAGFNPLQEISKRTGVSMADLKAKMSDGAISAKAVEMAFQAATGPGGQFYNMTEKIAQTDFGKLEALKGQVSGLALQVGGMLAPAIGDLITNYLSPLVDWLGQAANWVKENSTWIKTFIGGVLGIVAALKAWAVVQALLNPQLWNMARALMANPIGLVIGLIGLLVGGLIAAWNSSEKFRNTVKGVWQGLKDLSNLLKDTIINNIKNMLAGIAGLGKALYLFATGKFKQAFEEGKEAVLNLTGINTARQAYEGAKNLGRSWSNGVAEGIASGKGSVDFSKSFVLGKTGFGRTMQSGIRSQLKFLGGNWQSNLAQQHSTRKAEDAQRAKQLLAEINGGSASGGKGGRSLGASAVTSGGPKTITINVNREMIGEVSINSYNVREGVGEMEAMIEESLRRLLRSAASN